MTKTASTVGGAVLGAAAVGAVVGVVGPAFTVAGPRAGASSGTATQQFLSARPEAAAPAHAGLTLGAGVALAASGLVAASAVRRSRRAGAGAASAPAVVPVGLGCSVSAPAEQYFRDQLVACRAQLSEAGAPSVEETDQHMQELQAHAKQVLAGAAAALVFSSSMEAAVAYPIYAQQNYANPRALNGKIACANCHLAGKEIDVRMPHDVLADTIFKAQIDVPCKYEKRRQLIADGSKAALNIGAIAIMPEGWKLAPKDRLPKVLKKQMKGLSWSPYSKEYPNIVVAGPVPGSIYERMVLPILAPDPNTQKDANFGKLTMYFGGNRGRGQVYPEGNQSNNNQFFAKKDGKISAIDGLKVTIEGTDGSTVTQEVLAGGQIVVEVGEQVVKDDPLTTNPNVGGFGQAEKEMMLQDMNRVWAYCALATSIFVAQLTFVLKKKQFEKVQLAEGF
ncbi:unnamed protein product [Polarella glacialis]|uniref:Cytochrome f large domain-containing protein n=1 Tax=Polarella glacialis TaxID=89957 RepID=A0A813DZK5_POLGL|nr:unnamed protein product [Polarella glacialis]